MREDPRANIELHARGARVVREHKGRLLSSLGPTYSRELLAQKPPGV